MNQQTKLTQGVKYTQPPPVYLPLPQDAFEQFIKEAKKGATMSSFCKERGYGVREFRGRLTDVQHAYYTSLRYARYRYNRWVKDTANTTAYEPNLTFQNIEDFIGALRTRHRGRRLVYVRRAFIAYMMNVLGHGCTYVARQLGLDHSTVLHHRDEHNEDAADGFPTAEYKATWEAVNQWMVDHEIR